MLVGAINTKAFSFSECCVSITVWKDVKIEAVYWTWSWRWLRGSWSSDTRPSHQGSPCSCCWAAPAPPTGAASAVSPPSSLASTTVRYLQDLQYLQCPHHAMSRVTAAVYSGYEALSPRPSYYLSATREIFASCGMSLRNLQITITIDVCYAKKAPAKAECGKSQNVFKKKHPNSLFSVFRSWIFRQNIWKVWSKGVDMHLHY